MRNETTLEEKRIYQREYRIRNREKVRQIERRDRLKNKDKYNMAQRIRHKLHPEKKRAAWHRWYAKNKLQRKEYLRQYRSKNKEHRRMVGYIWWTKNRQKLLARNRAWRERHKEQVRIQQKEYCRKNLRKIIQKKCAYVARRLKVDVPFRLAMQCRTRIWFALKDQNATKSKKSFDLIGCSPEFFKQFIEAQFTNGMSWENYGKEWHIDHIIPVSKFDLKQPEEQKRAFHYSNCRPFPKVENIVKADKMPEPHQALLI